MVYIARFSNRNAARRVRNRELKGVATAFAVAILLLMFAATVIFDLHKSKPLVLVVVYVSLTVWLIFLQVSFWFDGQRLKIYAEYGDVMEVAKPVRGDDGTYDHYFEGKGGLELLTSYRRWPNPRRSKTDDSSS